MKDANIETKKDAIMLWLIIATYISVFGGMAILTWFPNLLSAKGSLLSYVLFAMASAIAIADFLCMRLSIPFAIFAVTEIGIVGAISQHIWRTTHPTFAVLVISLVTISLISVRDIKKEER